MFLFFLLKIKYSNISILHNDLTFNISIFQYFGFSGILKVKQYTRMSKVFVTGPDAQKILSFMKLLKFELPHPNKNLEVNYILGWKMQGRQLRLQRYAKIEQVLI